MKKTVFVNNTAATSGGALTILKQYLVQFAEDSSTEYYVFCTADLAEYETENVHIINDIQGKKYIDRLKWDFYGMKKWSKQHEITPDEILSLQNTKVFKFKCPQTIYLHQSIPYYREYKWNIFKKEERVLWFYRNIYSYLIDISLKNNKVIVQTEWMKQRVIQKNKKFADEISVIPPKVTQIDTDEINIIASINQDKYNLFYPAAAAKYKNHKILFEALENLSDDYRLYLTVDKESFPYVAKNPNLKNKVIFLGSISYEEVLALYKTVNCLVFPSYIETYGLPLVEAQQFNLKIVAADVDYAREVLSKYEKVKYCNHADKLNWRNNIKRMGD